MKHEIRTSTDVRGDTTYVKIWHDDVCIKIVPIRTETGDITDGIYRTQSGDEVGTIST